MKFGFGCLMAAALVLAAMQVLPPPEAFNEHLSYQGWKVEEVKIEQDGEIAVLHLRHPDGKIKAILHYRLVSSVVVDAP